MVGVWLRMKRRRDAVTCQKTSLFKACIKKLSQRSSARNAVVYSCKVSGARASLTEILCNAGRSCWAGMAFGDQDRLRVMYL